ncbi:MAG: hypothetical protein ABT11_14710 [Novosphingobium sp. SCN 66-18]|nr:MAG: hypothetical protein ABT11_14710 [Novosphingobium sp. SCN 66-18]
MLVLPILMFTPQIVPASARLHMPVTALMQIGPNPSPQEGAALPIPRRHRPADSAPSPAPASPPQPRAPDRLSVCLAKALHDPAMGLAEARGWLAEGQNPEQRVRANQCLGIILTQQGQFDAAEQAFADAIAGVPMLQEVAAVPLMAMAGNAALAGGHPDRALVWLDKAVAVRGYADNAALGDIQTDRARALVALDRPAEAATALDEAHRLAPDLAEGWLLSATLARRNKDMPRAQRDIEVAAHLDATDPAIGLEAGVIAVLDGRDEAARKSWESVVRTAPDSDEAKTAKGYLEQLGPAPTSGATPSASPPSGATQPEKKPS